MSTIRKWDKDLNKEVAAPEGLQKGDWVRVDADGGTHYEEYHPNRHHGQLPTWEELKQEYVIVNRQLTARLIAELEGVDRFRIHRAEQQHALGQEGAKESMLMLYAQIDLIRVEGNRIEEYILNSNREEYVHQEFVLDFDSISLNL